jgi:hypothetical protein
VTKVEVRVASSNNGFVTNLIDNISTVKTKSLLDAPAAIPFSNGFQASSIPADWTVFNPTSDHGWQGFPSAGSNSTRSALCDFYNIAEGDSALLVSPKINLVGASGPTALAFDYAYTYYDDTLFDSLRVEVSANCGETWTTLFHDGYNGLVTAAPRTTSYIPANSDWVTRTFDLTSYNGAEILIRFLAESGYGNNLYIDNINVAQTTGVKELTLNTFDLTPNPTRNVANVRFSLAKPESVRLLVFNSIGALVQTQDLGELSTGEFNQKLDATNLNSGSYRVVLQGKEGVAQTQWVIVK